MNACLTSAVAQAAIQPPARKRTLLALVNCADADGTATLSMAEIATSASISKCQARRYVRGFVGCGLLSVLAGERGGDPTAKPIYRLDLAKLGSNATPRTEDASPPQLVRIESGQPAATKPTRRPAKTAIPADFALSGRVRAWAEAKGHAALLPQHLEAFKLKALARAWRYVDWDAAFMNAIRADWGQVRSKPSTHTGFAEKDYGKGIGHDGSIV